MITVELLALVAPTCQPAIGCQYTHLSAERQIDVVTKKGGTMPLGEALPLVPRAMAQLWAGTTQMEGAKAREEVAEAAADPV
jgi:hypothetical protein